MGIGAHSTFALGPIQPPIMSGPIATQRLFHGRLEMPFILNSYSYIEGFQAGIDEPYNTFNDLSSIPILRVRWDYTGSVISMPEPSSILAYALALAIGSMTGKRNPKLDGLPSHLNHRQPVDSFQRNATLSSECLRFQPYEDSGTISIAPHGHSAAHSPHPLQ